MSTIALAPPHPETASATSAFGLPFAARPVTEELRRILPPSTAEALDAIVKQMRASVFDPLLYATSQEDLRDRFTRLFRTYWLQYMSASLQLASAAAHEPSAVAAVIVRELAEWRAPSEMARVLGDDAAVMFNVAVDVASRVTRRSIRTLVARPSPAASHEHELEWLNGIVLFSMSIAPVVDALQDSPVRGRRENLVLLTIWARMYAIQLFAVSRRLGWIPEATPIEGAAGVPLATGPDDEERDLAEAGLREWAERLTAQEQDGDPRPR